MVKTLKLNTTIDFTSKFEQIDASVRFALMEVPVYYENISGMREKVEKAILYMVVDGPCPLGYHFYVLRAALCEYTKHGLLIDDVPYDLDKINPSRQNYTYKGQVAESG